MTGSDYTALRAWFEKDKLREEAEKQAAIEAWIERDNLRELVKERMKDPERQERIREILARHRRVVPEPKPEPEPDDIREAAALVEWLEHLRSRYMAAPKTERQDLLDEALPDNHGLRDLEARTLLARQQLQQMRSASAGPKRYDINDPNRVRAPGGVPPEALEHAAHIILTARARRLADTTD